MAYPQRLEKTRNHVVDSDRGHPFDEGLRVEGLVERLEQRIVDLHLARHRVGKLEHRALERSERDAGLRQSQRVDLRLLHA
jgi:hypothetical protein